MVRLVAAVVAASSLLAGCTDAPEDDATGGYLATQETVGALPGARLEISGTLRVLANGCLVLERDNGKQPWIVWPPGAVPGPQGGAKLGSEVYLPGDRVTATGTIAVLADLPGGNRDDSYYGTLGHYCDGDAVGVAVLDSIRHAAG
ncbi:hypothetical protein [Demequina rhizosphaerae]|uniref:hypothetical protein n=1 Tax=Demequina rhizosphaerae TaxID=1638985 RepID=UPI000785A56E|nr:hypothetical protein [Demequina rhizosphaerae]